jgi:hypothetical protein
MRADRTDTNAKGRRYRPAAGNLALTPNVAVFRAVGGNWPTGVQNHCQNSASPLDALIGEGGAN